MRTTSSTEDSNKIIFNLRDFHHLSIEEIHTLTNGSNLYDLMVHSVTVLGHGCTSDVIFGKAEEGLKILLRRGANINAVDNDGKTVLMHAIEEPYESSKKVIELLIANGANIHATDNDGKTVLMYANNKIREVSNLEIAKLLVDEGADVNAADKNGKTVLMYATKSGGDIKHLVANGADVNAVDKDGKSVLMYAVEREDLELLIEHGAIVDDILKIAANSENKEETLVSLLFLVDCNDFIMRTANREDGKEDLELLINSAKSSDNDDTLISALAYAAGHPDGEKAVKVLIANGVTDESLSASNQNSPNSRPESPASQRLKTESQTKDVM